MSPAGNVYCSVLLRPRCRAPEAAQLGFVAALAIADAMAELAPNVAIRCKWPNDVLANGRKISGILLETEMVAGDVPDFVVIGIGVNLATSPPEALYPATSLVEEGVSGILPQRMSVAFVWHLARWLTPWREQGFAPIRAAWLDRAAGLGEPIQVRLEHATFGGRFLDLDEDGALLLGTPEGDRRIAAGEVFPVAA
jgi:BirA family biotin operon repressor/biotin-[acetyl-CoA-carboxylase] ligase